MLRLRQIPGSKQNPFISLSCLIRIYRKCSPPLDFPCWAWKMYLAFLPVTVCPDCFVLVATRLRGKVQETGFFCLGFCSRHMCQFSKHMHLSCLGQYPLCFSPELPFLRAHCGQWLLVGWLLDRRYSSCVPLGLTGSGWRAVIADDILVYWHGRKYSISVSSSWSGIWPTFGDMSFLSHGTGRLIPDQAIIFIDNSRC